VPKQVKPEELDAIVQAIGKHPEGVGIEALFEKENLGVPRRTLQRRLSQLVSDKRLVAEGKGRALQYRIAESKGESRLTLDALTIEAYGETYVPLSPEGEEIKTYVRQSSQMRRPVSYNYRFLESYQPNATEYLPQELRTQLHRLGRSSYEERPAGTFARHILHRLLIDLSWASSRLEGNTYSRLDTQRLIEFGQAAEGKDALETQMILNHKAAIEMLVKDADLVGFDTFTVLNLHALLSDGLLPNPEECGRLRQRPVEIGGSVYLPLAMPQRIEEHFRRILEMAALIQDPFEQAFFAMVHLPYLQPFVDINKRVSRLAANIPLIKQNVCPLSFIDVPEKAYIDAMLGIYELNRVELLRDVFVWAYERSCQNYIAIQKALCRQTCFAFSTGLN
jgi:fido (protein-threonine AMPylation protein)